MHFAFLLVQFTFSLLQFTFSLLQFAFSLLQVYILFLQDDTKLLHFYFIIFPLYSNNFSERFHPIGV